MKLRYKLVIVAFVVSVIGSFIWSAGHYYSKYQHEKERADEAVRNAESATAITRNVLQSLQIINTVIEAMVLSGMLSVCVCCNVTKACVSYVCVLVWRVKRKPLTTSSLKYMAALMPTVICRVCAGRVIRRRRPVNGLSDNNSQLSEGRGGSNLCDLTSSGLPAPSFFYTREK